ncbi:VOC family protein [Rhizobium miluonense]|jgi:catechol 2,3-dioxygenase-like lactoylglutathione lyase family enzyme|uniref:Catechol 2,3-dioxygenase-like lactoylglutathione lyase family enzyme n=1 Tax=Rhizobium miluonense TaxID=411945 RepID=A0ABU1SPD3_9HYPH|nr:VOC family protein [Rhizobium miluonense]MDR6900846.1 catechol 2,3-dioxygenase-like lactoylglutathione lyase family enzyme [Rhizobium miluonense]
MPLGRITLYARNVDATVSFYEKHFGFKPLRLEGDRIVELLAQDGGANLLIHPAGKAQKMGQVLVKLVFDVEHVEAFRTKCAEEGLEFGPLHQADGYVFANAKDPSGNPIAISSRAFRLKSGGDEPPPPEAVDQT